MTRPIVIGIDPGRNAGFAVVEGHPINGGASLVSAQSVRLPAAASQRLRHLMDVLTAWDTAHPGYTVRAVVIEHPVPIYAPDGSIRNRKGYETQIRDLHDWQNACQARYDLWPIEVYPSEWRARWHMRNKAEVIRYARSVMRIDSDDHNMMEAAVIALYGLHRYGWRPEDVPMRERPNESPESRQRRWEMHSRLINEGGADPLMWRI